MKNFADAIKAIYDWMLIKWDFGGFDISFWDIFLFTIIASIICAILCKIFGLE